jgi:hypothetical protein
MKGKKRVQIGIASFLTIIPLIDLPGILRFVVGKPFSLIDIIALIAFVYFLMNLLYCKFSKEEIAETKVREENEIKKVVPESKPIIEKKNYSSVKSSPKVAKINEENKFVEKKVIITDEEIQEVKEQEDYQKYSGILNVDDEVTIEKNENVNESETELPDTNTALFNKVSKTKFF